MHFRTRRLALLFASILAGSLAISASQVATAATATQQVIVVPVTATGDPAPGYTVTPHSQGPEKVECGLQSTASTSPEVQNCGTSSEGGFACLKSATPHQVLCLVDALKHSLITLAYSGKFPASPNSNFLGTQPMDIVLTDGTHCAIREGGADDALLKGHPQYAPLYFCNRHGDVWGKVKQGYFGVNESSPTWTVRTAPHSGNAKLITRRIAKAYFVGAPTS